MASLSKYVMLARTLPRLGFGNIARVAAYRAALKLPSKIKKLSADTPQGPFFGPPETDLNGPAPSSLWDAAGTLFSFHPVEVSEAPPNWLSNPLTGAAVKNADKPWHAIPDFDADVGDIKLIWELSRMTWAPAFAQRAKRGDRASLARLNTWLQDWITTNPPYQGPHWKCGQEASLRVLHLIVAAHILGTATPALTALIKLHLSRIAPTVSYAMAQDNNHGTSEAAALFIGGNFTGNKKHEALGRKLLENRTSKLIGDDGSFSQYSVVYHRLMLDALSLSEWWRAKHKLPEFSAPLVKKMNAASEWLYRMTDARTGGAPNIGANDGAQILQLTDAPYRDFRPSVSLAFAVGKKTAAYPENALCGVHLHWLGLDSDLKTSADIKMTVGGEDGGFAVITDGKTKAVLRHPRFKFRPAQADALHLDLWHKGVNVLRDGGTYSYNTKAETMAYFGGAEAHNSVQFDGRDQMPKLGRFLYGDWLAAEYFKAPSEQDKAASVSYIDAKGARHARHIALTENLILITDDISGFNDAAIMRLRLVPDDYTFSIINAAEVTLTSKTMLINIRTEMPITAVLTTGFESLHYLDKTPLPVLEITAQLAGTLTTKIEFL